MDLQLNITIAPVGFYIVCIFTRSLTGRFNPAGK
jgi:hypothetical protein